MVREEVVLLDRIPVILLLPAAGLLPFDTCTLCGKALVVAIVDVEDGNLHTICWGTGICDMITAGRRRWLLLLLPASFEQEAFIVASSTEQQT